jgi:hypothetical protein
MTIGNVAAGIAAWMSKTCLRGSESVPQVATARIVHGSKIIRTGTDKPVMHNIVAHGNLPK